MKATNILRLPQYLHKIRENIDELYKLVQSLNHQVIIARENEQEAQKRIASLRNDIEGLRVRNSELEHLVQNRVRTADGTATTAAPAPRELFAANHNLDAFYLEFENRFRGSEEEIRQKQEPYIEVFKRAGVDKKLPVADLGCGRGEFLELLTKGGFRPVGVDMNESMVARAHKRGFEAVQNDAISYLSSQKSSSLSGVTGFHLAEHIPFESLLTLIAEAYRCLAKGGILMLETPNPESVFVGAFTFHYDPSHLKPLPPAVVQFAAEFKGFSRVEIMRTQPELTSKQITQATKNPALQNALQRLYGPRDYALVAYR